MSRRWVAPFLAMALIASACSTFESAAICQVCGRPIHGQVFYRVSLRDGSARDVCCPRCGLRFQVGRKDVVGVQVTDFNSGKLIDATQALFVESSRVMLCCSDTKVQRDRSGAQYALNWDRCMPSLVAFETLEEAELFSRQKGGVVKDYSQLQEEPEFSEAGTAFPENSPERSPTR